MRSTVEPMRQSAESIFPETTSEALKKLMECNAVVIHGKPGVGKSAFAKALVSKLNDEGKASVITLSPEDFNSGTFEQVLHKAEYSATLEQLLKSPLTDGRLLIWVESFEKILESRQQEAFTDLLQQMKKHPRLCLVLTTRDYLLQKFKVSFHFELPAGDIFYNLNNFSDDEIAIIKEKEPNVTQLFENPRIQEFLRTPFYLDKALRILPHLTRVEKLDEATFKRIMWEQIVEDGDTNRGHAFYELALHRARELSLYASSSEPVTLLNSLVADNILTVEPGELANRYSPAHDILEDWALIRYIKLKRQEASTSREFLNGLEQNPAIRRAFRLWLEEYSRQESIAYEEFIKQVINETDSASDWQDEIMVASLRSSHAIALFNALGNRLLENSGLLLRHVLHLLQTSCKTVGSYKGDLNNFLPVGSGWDEMIRFIKRNHTAVLKLETFEFAYLAMIEDWARQLKPFDQDKLPSAAPEAAWLLEDFIYRFQDKIVNYQRGKNDTSFLKRYAKTLFKLTAAAKDLIGPMLEAALDPSHLHTRWTNQDVLESIRDYAVADMMSDQLCKYFPHTVFRIAQEDWPAKPETHPPGSLMAMIIPQPEAKDFGLDKRLQDELDYPNAYQTFLYWMLRYHPEKAMDFLISFFNHAIEHNQQILRQLESKELSDVRIIFSDGNSKTYYGTREYWQMFRGFNVRSRLLSSLLMALEKTLLDLCSAGGEKFIEAGNIIKKILLEANNVSMLATVSSVVQAYPGLIDESSVYLFSAPQLLAWDQSRFSNDYLPGDLYHSNPALKEERALSNTLPHRLRHVQGLIGLSAHYMFYYGDFNDILFRIVDNLWETADPNDLTWQKLLTDMDARKYRLEPVDVPGYENYRQLVPGYEPAVQKMRQNSIIDRPPINPLWPRDVFEGKEGIKKTITIWREVREGYRNTRGGNLFMTSPATLATVGLQEFANELNEEEMSWCRQELINRAEKELKKKDLMDFSSSSFDTEAVMTGISQVFKTQMSAEVEQKVTVILFRLLTAEIDERSALYLQAGVAFDLHRFNPDLARNLWYGILQLLKKKRLSDTRQDVPFREEYFGYADPEQAAEEELAHRKEISDQIIDGTIQIPREDRCYTH